MKLVILSVGKVKDARVASLVHDYVRRLRPFAQVEWEVVKGADLGRRKDEALRIEGERLLGRLQEDDVVVLLNERGTQWDSVRFARWLDEQRTAARRVVFVVGGPWGTSDMLERRANVKLALSSLTLQHDLALLLLAEQLYRAFSILSGHPYHK